MGLYVHGSVLGVETKTTKEKKQFSVIHILDGFEKTEVIANGGKNVNYGDGELVEIPVKQFKDKLYLADKVS